MGQTADQIRELADLFAAMSSTVDDYRTQHFDQLGADERLRLEQLFQQLSDLHDQFTALAIQDTLDGIAADLDQVVAVTSEAQRSLSRLNTIAEITKLVSAAAELGSDISIADYGAIPHALQDIMQALPKRADH